MDESGSRPPGVRRGLCASDRRHRHVSAAASAATPASVSAGQRDIRSEVRLGSEAAMEAAAASPRPAGGGGGQEARGREARGAARVAGKASWAGQRYEGACEIDMCRECSSPMQESRYSSSSGRVGGGGVAEAEAELACREGSSRSEPPGSCRPPGSQPEGTEGSTSGPGKPVEGSAAAEGPAAPLGCACGAEAVAVAAAEAEAGAGRVERPKAGAGASGALASAGPAGARVAEGHRDTAGGGGGGGEGGGGGGGGGARAAMPASVSRTQPLSLSTCGVVNASLVIAVTRLSPWGCLDRQPCDQAVAYEGRVGSLAFGGTGAGLGSP
jgi:hypothetical protein